MFPLHEHISHTIHCRRSIESEVNRSFYAFVFIFVVYFKVFSVIAKNLFKKEKEKEKKMHVLIHPLGGSNLPPVCCVVSSLWRRKQTLGLVSQWHAVNLPTHRIGAQSGATTRSNNRQMSR